MSATNEYDSYKTFPKEIVNSMISDFKSGFSTTKLVEKYKTSLFSILAILKYFGVYEQRPHKKEQRYPNGIGLEMRKDLDSGMFIKDICKKYGLSKCAVQKYMQRAGVYHDTPYKEKVKKHKSMVDEAIRLYKSGIPMLEIASILNVHEAAVDKAIDSGGIKRDRNKPFLTDEMKSIVEKEYLDGKMHKEIATSLGCSLTIVYNHIVGLDKKKLFFIEKDRISLVMESIKRQQTILNISSEYSIPRKKIEVLIKNYPNLKICRKCDTAKEKDSFWGNNNGKRLYHSCKICGASQIKQDFDSNIDKRIQRQLRTRLNNVIQRGQKCASTMTLLGCALEDFLKHIESQFTKNMSWDNYGEGGWVLDHIKAVNRYENLSDPIQQKECFHWTNFQPLWATTSIAISWGESSEYIGNNEKHNFAIRGGIHGKTPL